MKYDLLSHLKEYKELLENKFGVNSINLVYDNLHNKIESNNSINFYLRERLGNLEFSFVNNNFSVKEYGLEDIENEGGYKFSFFKSNNSRIKDYIDLSVRSGVSLGLKLQNDVKVDKYLLYGDDSGIIYVKFDKNSDYLLIEKVLFGEKVDIKSISSRYYDKTAFKYIATLYLNESNLCNEASSKNIIEFIEGKLEENVILPEVEFFSDVDEKEMTVKKDNGSVDINLKRYIYENDFCIDVFSDSLTLDSKDNFHDDRSFVYGHFSLIREYNDLLLDRLNLVDVVNCSVVAVVKYSDTNNYEKKRRRF